MKIHGVVVVAFLVSFSHANSIGNIADELSHVEEILVNFGKHEVDHFAQQLLSHGMDVLMHATTDVMAHPSQGKRGLSSLLSGGKEIVNLLVNQVKGIASSGVQQIGALAGQVLGRPIQIVTNGINSAVSTAHSLLDGVVHSIPDKVQDLAGNLPIGKRSVNKILTTFGTQLKAAFKPIIESLKQMISDIGTLAKNVTGSVGNTEARLRTFKDGLRDILAHTNNIPVV